MIQRGARRRYAVPRILEGLGMLHQVVTDAHSTSTLGSLAKIAAATPFSPSSVHRLSARQLTEKVPSSKVTAIDSWLWHDWRLRPLKNKNLARWFEERDRIWSTLVLPQLRFEGANILYSMGDENLRVLREARRRGIRTIVDAFISPYSMVISRDEKLRLNIPPAPYEHAHEAFESHYRSIYQECDVVLCPSHWVAEGITQLDNSLAPKLVICPYGTSIAPAKEIRDPIPRRVFWAGADWLRKGLHKLAGAADLLSKSHPDYEFRAAGVTDPEVTSMPRFSGINFLGKLNHSRMREEFLKADVFVFPSLSEGMAGVVVEALACECPVIATKASGVDLIEQLGCGRLLDSSTPETLAHHIRSICEDRPKIEQMNLATRAASEFFGMEEWSHRLQELVLGILPHTSTSKSRHTVPLQL
mgnify:CR=1 FL=1